MCRERDDKPYDQSVVEEIFHQRNLTRYYMIYFPQGVTSNQWFKQPVEGIKTLELMIFNIDSNMNNINRSG